MLFPKIKKKTINLVVFFKIKSMTLHLKRRRKPWGEGEPKPYGCKEDTSLHDSKYCHTSLHVSKYCDISVCSTLEKNKNKFMI